MPITGGGRTSTQTYTRKSLTSTAAARSSALGSSAAAAVAAAKHRRSHGGPTTVAVALEPRKAQHCKRRRVSSSTTTATTTTTTTTLTTRQQQQHKRQEKEAAADAEHSYDENSNGAHEEEEEEEEEEELEQQQEEKDEGAELKQYIREQEEQQADLLDRVDLYINNHGRIPYYQPGRALGTNRRGRFTLSSSSSSCRPSTRTSKKSSSSTTSTHKHKHKHAHKPSHPRPRPLLDPLPSDVLSRIFFSGYFDTLFVLNRLSLVNKRFYALASSSQQHLDLSRLPKLNPPTLRRVVARFTHTHTLDLSFCDKVDDDAVLELLPLQGALTHLHLRGCPVSDMGVRVLATFTQLQVLDLSKKNADQCLLITDLGIQALTHLKKITHISLAWNKCVTDDGVCALVQAIAPYQRLKYVDLSCCVGLTNRACVSLATQPLSYLSLIDCPMLTDSGVGALVGGKVGMYVSMSVARAHIQTLKLAHCPLLSDGCVEGVCALPQLRELDMRDCRGVSNEGRTKVQKRLATALVGLS